MRSKPPSGEQMLSHFEEGEGEGEWEGEKEEEETEERELGPGRFYVGVCQCRNCHGSFG